MMGHVFEALNLAWRALFLRGHDYTYITQLIVNRLQVENISEYSVFRQVMKAIHKLKSSQKMVFQLSSNCLREAPVSLVDHIAVLLIMFLFHGYVPPEVLTCGMIPLVKDSKGGVSSSVDYRTIGLSTVLVKVFEYVLLFKSYQYLSTSDQQFDYKQQHSTIQ